MFFVILGHSLYNWPYWLYKNKKFYSNWRTTFSMSLSMQKICLLDVPRKSQPGTNQKYIWYLNVARAWQLLTILCWFEIGDKTCCCLLLVSSLVRSPGMTNINNWLFPAHTLWHGHRWSDTNMHNWIKWWSAAILLLTFCDLPLKNIFTWLKE